MRWDGEKGGRGKKHPPSRQTCFIERSDLPLDQSPRRNGSKELGPNKGAREKTVPCDWVFAGENPARPTTGKNDDGFITETVPGPFKQPIVKKSHW